jgi:hypothetical protein
MYTLWILSAKLKSLAGMMGSPALIMGQATVIIENDFRYNDW